VSAAAVDSSGRIKKKVVSPTDPEAGTASVIASVEKLLASGCDVTAIGVGVAAFVDLDGKVVFSPNLSYGEPDVGRAVGAKFGLPVAVDNDANLAALAEFRFGVGRQASPMLMLTLGTGVGGALLIDGEVYRGANGLAGEFGHMVVSTNGPACACGKKGCLEALSSGTAIARMGAEAMSRYPDGLIGRLSGGDPSKVSGELVADAAASGDDSARQVIADAGRWLGLGLAGLVDALDPALIVIGGGVVSDGDMSQLLLEPARSAMQDGLVGRSGPEVIRARLGNDAGMIGAAAMAADLKRA